MSDKDVAAVKGLYEAYRQKDLAAILGFFHPDIEVYQTELLPWGGRFRGHEGAKEFFGKIVEHVDSEVDLDDIIDAGDHIVAIGRSFGTVKSNGRPIQVKIAHVLRMEDGKVVSLDAYIDTPKALDVLAAPGE